MTRSFPRYQTLLPLRFNDGAAVPDELFGQVIVELRKRFGAVSTETQMIRGEWEQGEAIYYDERILQPMRLSNIQIITTIVLLSLTCGGVCLLRHLPMQKSAEIIDPMFPDGVEHDFGTLRSGVVATYVFRVVNTSNVPLRIISLRRS